MKNVFRLLLLLPLAGMAQRNETKFVEGLSWQQVKEQARKEGKFIFVDCYASWCGPCKMMDQKVYPVDSVGKLMNSRFICVRVQMDTTKKDDAATQGWYTDAHALMTDYKVYAYPTFLFFSPEGEIVHRGVGFQKPGEFLALAAKAMDPAQQYYALLRVYQSGKKNYPDMPYLANTAVSLDDRDLGMSIAADYLHHYLDKLSIEAICTPANLEFIGDFAKVLSSKDKVFQCFYRHPALVDSPVHDAEYADRMVNYIATKEEISPAVTAARKDSIEPDWTRIESRIRHRFGAAYVEKNVVKAKVGWYRYMQDWKNYTKNLTLQMDMQDLRKIPNGFGGKMYLNNSAWDVFQHSDNKEELQKAIAWSELAIAMEAARPSGNLLDTKAELLYKLGRKDDAISLEKKAKELDPKAKDIDQALQKMEQGEPTW